MTRDVSALTEQGRWALRRLDRDAAEAAFAQALEEDPTSVDAVAGLGQVAYERGQLDEAEQQFRRAVQQAQTQLGGAWPQRLDFANPRQRAYLRAIHGMGLILFRQAQPGEALAWFSLEQRLDPADHHGSRFMIRNIRAKKRFANLWHKSR